MSEHKALFAGSFDPFHYGHLKIVEKALRTFDELVIGVGVNPSKKYMFDIDERIKMIERTIKRLVLTPWRVKVVPFSGLTIHFAYEQDIPFMVKGIRNAKDMEYELGIINAESTQNLDIETEFLWTHGDLAKISSSTIKAILKEQGYIHKLVHPYVKQRMEETMHGQYIIGITGIIGAGKSTLANKFVKYGKELGIEVHNVELDHVVHKMYDGTYPEPRYKKIREQIIEEFGEDVDDGNGFINRKSLGGIVFGNPEQLEKLNGFISTAISVKICKELYGKKGLILLNSALLAEGDMLGMVNNNVINVYVDEKTQKVRLYDRGLNDEQIERRMNSQHSYEQKAKLITHNIMRHEHGRSFIMDGTVDDQRKVFTEILNNIGMIKK